MASNSDEPSFFDKERDRLVGEITTGFEGLLSSSNSLNRKLEEVLGMSREYQTIAELWQSFHELMRGQLPTDEGEVSTDEQQVQGLPGTGSHVLAANKE
ncbi:DASH outer kinetochore protein [Abortiporus biennis]|nr:DASH outer kinetochore protein [Abortiporus biennis]